AIEGCSVPIVIRVSDSCGNFTDYSYNARVDGTAPTATQGTIGACFQTTAAANQAALAATTALLDNCDPAPSKAVHTSAIEGCSVPIVIRVSDWYSTLMDYSHIARADATAPT